MAESPNNATPVVDSTGYSVNHPLVNHKSAGAQGEARSQYSLPANGGEEMFAYGYYNKGLSSIPTHPVEGIHGAPGSTTGINSPGTAGLV